MKASVYDIDGEVLREVELPDSLFGVEPNRGLMHQALLRQMANARQGTHKTKTRGEVLRTGKKWYRQKGTGRARHGARSAPIFVGGGVAHGPRPRKYVQRMPRKMRHLALRSALSVKAAEQSVALIDGLTMDAPRTKTIRGLVDKACGGASTLVLLANRNSEVEQSIRNLPDVHYLGAAYLNIRDLLGHDRILIEAEALDRIVELFGATQRAGAEA